MEEIVSKLMDFDYNPSRTHGCVCPHFKTKFHDLRGEMRRRKVMEGFLGGGSFQFEGNPVENHLKV